MNLVISAEKLIEITHWKVCYQRLKKRIEDCDVNLNAIEEKCGHAGSDEGYIELNLKGELQKIMEEKK